MADFLASYGPGLLFLVVALEAAGLVLPGETTLIAAAALATHGNLDIVAVIVVGAFGAIPGETAATGWAGAAAQLWTVAGAWFDLLHVTVFSAHGREEARV